MIELYVAVTLLGIGYLINNNKTSKDPISNSPHVKEAKVTAHVVNKMETKNATKMHKQAMQQPAPKVVSRVPQNVFRSPLSGKIMDPRDFVHNNMVPFFKKGVTPSLGNRSVLENFSGLYNPDVMQLKKEQEPLFAPTKDLGNVYGTRISTDFYRGRLEKPKAQNNTLPFQQVKVGPGLNRGFSSMPTGGFQQYDALDYAKPKTTDELRAANKPKLTYEGRVVDGQKGSMRGQISEVHKNRADTFYENNPERYFRTTGAHLADTQRPEYNTKATNRQDMLKGYNGPAYQKIAFASRAQVRDPLRSQLAGFDVANAVVVNSTPGTKDDYGKANILVYANERDLTTTQTRQGNLASLVKAIVAPLEDVMKTSKKEFMVDAERQFGNVGIQVPNKATVRDPNDVLRTTIKETTVHDSQMLNLKGATRVSVYDPNDTARTTVKETTTHDAQVLNLRGAAFKTVVYDPNDVARTTTKETTLHDADMLNLKGARLATHVFDPNDVARTTVKELMVHDTDLANVRVVSRGVVYDVDEAAKTTVRQTLDPTETTLNMRLARGVGTVYDPNDTARTTIKETLIDDVRDGNIDALSRRNMGYTNENYEAKTTQKELFSDNDYIGVATQDQGKGYTVANVHAKDTQKQFFSDKEHFGGLMDQNTHASMSYDDAYNAVIDDLKESTLVGRDPTQTSVKLVSGVDAITMQIKKEDCDEVAERDTYNMDRIVNEVTNIDPDTITRNRQDYDDDDRLDIDILKAFKENPYTKPLDSVA